MYFYLQDILNFNRYPTRVYSINSSKLVKSYLLFEKLWSIPSLLFLRIGGLYQDQFQHSWQPQHLKEKQGQTPGELQ